MTTLRNKTRAGVFGIAISMFLFLFPLAPQKANAQVGVNISFQTFYDNLAPYGTWFNDPQYGYVWAPRVGNDFRPYYTNGYWINTNYGNMWMSDYPWGWAAFHYGRWTYSNLYGWIWVPGNEWGPAWVTWRQGDGYYGWAPMGPGVTINISFGSSYYVPDGYWTFIPYNYLYARSFHRYYVPGRTTVIYRNTTIINNTYINNNSTYVTGPRRSSVVSRTGSSVRTYQVGSSNTAGRSSVSGDRVAVYRPAVRRDNVSEGVTSRPRNVSATTSVVPRTAEVPRESNSRTTPVQRTTTESSASAQSRTAPSAPAASRTTAAPRAETRTSAPRSSSSIQRSAPARNTVTTPPTQSRTVRTAPPAKPATPPKVQERVQRSAPAPNVRTQSTSVQRSAAPAPRQAPSRSVPTQSTTNTRAARR